MEITVCTDRESLLAELRKACHSFSFVPCGELAHTQILIVDLAGDGRMPGRGSEVVRILLSDHPSRSRSARELEIDEPSFLRSASAILDFAADLASSETRRRELEATTVTDAAIRELLEASDLDEVCERITETLVKQLNLPGGSLFFHEPVRELFALTHSLRDEETAESDLTDEVLEQIHRSVGSELPHVIIRHNASRQRLALPILVKEDLVGVFLSAPSATLTTDRAKLRTALSYLSGVTAVVSSARQISQNRDLAMRDDLTKAFNRRYFESYLDEEIERTRRYGSVFSIIFLDLDDLKLINNAHGHLTGSRVLQEVAKRILSAVRTIDKVVRFGGDEFCIILPETDKDQAMSVAMRVRKAMSASSFQIEPEVEVNITASFGIATYPNHALTKEGLIRQADDAMYRVKSTTKNAIGIAGEFDANRAETAVR